MIPEKRVYQKQRITVGADTDSVLKVKYLDA